MIPFFVYNFGAIWLWLNRTAEEASEKVKASRSAKVSGDELARIRTGVKQLQQLCQELHLDKTYEQCFNLETRLSFLSCFWTVIESGLDGIKTTLPRELQFREFAYIPHDKAEFFEGEALFGKRVHNRFRSARSDIKEAGNSLAADMHTAAVFHLMRVAEIGMRALAKHLHVRIVRKRTIKLCTRCKLPLGEVVVVKSTLTPLDYALWEDVLKALDVKIKKVQNIAKGKKRTAEYEFYHDIVLSLNAFKDIWRNEVSHCRRTFDEHDAKRAFIHTKALLERLSTRLRE
jgi:hypothetical protein